MADQDRPGRVQPVVRLRRNHLRERPGERPGRPNPATRQRLPEGRTDRWRHATIEGEQAWDQATLHAPAKAAVFFARGLLESSLPIRQSVHQRPLPAPRLPRRTSSAAHKSGVSERIETFMDRPFACPAGRLQTSRWVATLADQASEAIAARMEGSGPAQDVIAPFGVPKGPSRRARDPVR